MSNLEDTAMAATAPIVNGNGTSHPLSKPKMKVCHVCVNAKRPDYGRTAMTMFLAGSIPIPLRPRSDRPAVGCDRWLEELSPDTIQRYWQDHPGHGLGVILDLLAPVI
jgi:hypothetical protein